MVVELGFAAISAWVKKNILGIELPKLGVSHADELSVLFPVAWDSDIIPGGKDYQMSVDVIKLWVAFAKNEPLKIQNTLWKPVAPKAIKYLKLDKITSQVDPPFQKRLDVWESLKNVKKIHQ